MPKSVSTTRMFNTFRDAAGIVRESTDLDQLLDWADVIVVVTAHAACRPEPGHRDRRGSSRGGGAMTGADRPAATAINATTKPRGSPTTSRPSTSRVSYERCCALAYLAAWNVHPGAGLWALRTNNRGPAVRAARRPGHERGAVHSARRVLWVVDNGSSH